MVTTDMPAPLEHNPEMINFDYNMGHIPMIGQLPYEYFNQNIYELYPHISTDPGAIDLLHDDFSNMVNGDQLGVSPELINLLDNSFPDLDTCFYHDELQNDSFNVNPDHVSFGSSMSDYYTDWEHHHEEMAHHDIEHGDYDSAQNDLNYAHDDHNHAIDELNNDTDIDI